MPATAAAIPGRPASPDRSTRRILTLALAREFRDDLVKRGRVRVAMTRDDDRYLTLDAARRGRSAAECRFVRVAAHGQRAQSACARGDRLFALRCRIGCRGGTARRRPERGRAESASSGRSIQAMLSDLAMQAQMRASADLAARLVDKASGRLELRPNPHRFASFHVLRRAEAPAVLFEAGYISNADDEVLLRTPGAALEDRACPCPGDRNRRRRARAPLTGFPHQPRTG